MFVKENKNTFKFTEADPSNIIPKLEAGLYDIKIEKSMFGKTLKYIKNTTFTKKDQKQEGVYKESQDAIDKFLDPVHQQIKKDMGMHNRLGMLFHGLPGTGKTFTAIQLGLQLVEKKDAIVIITNELDEINLVETVDNIRASDDSNRLIVLIFDEFEKSYPYCNTTKLLGFLDGTDSRDNVVVLATANDISKLPNTLLDRPGRFEKVLEYAIGNDTVRTTIIESLIPEVYKDKVTVADIDDFCKDVKDINIDTIRIIVRDYIYYILKEEKEENITFDSFIKSSIKGNNIIEENCLNIDFEEEEFVLKKSI